MEMPPCAANSCYAALTDPVAFCSSYFGTTTLTSIMTLTSLDTEYQTITASSATPSFTLVEKIELRDAGNTLLKKRKVCPPKTSSASDSPSTTLFTTSTSSLLSSTDTCSDMTAISSVCSCAGVTGPAQTVVLESTTVDLTSTSTVTVAAPTPTSTAFVLQDPSSELYFYYDIRASTNDAVYLTFGRDPANAQQFVLDRSSGQLTIPSQGLSSYPAEADFSDANAVVLASQAYVQANNVGVYPLTYYMESGPYYPGDTGTLRATGQFNMLTSCGDGVQVYDSGTYAGTCEGYQPLFLFV